VCGCDINVILIVGKSMAPACWCRSWSCMQSSSHIVHWRQSCWTTSVESRCWECTCSRFTAVYQNIWCRAADCQHRYIYASCLFVKDIISSSSHIFFIVRGEANAADIW